MAQQTLRCYHHHNCEDRPAVARCSKCGKGLCRECADNLKSEDTGDILCVDCLNKEMATDVAWANSIKSDLKKEMITIIVGFIIGLFIEIFLIAKATGDNSEEFWTTLMMFSFVLFLPTLLASLKTIVTRAHYFRKKISYRFDSLIIKIICYSISVTFFFILCAISPIMFVWRLVRRAKDRKLLQRFADLQTKKYQDYTKYAKLAAEMSTTLTTEEFRQQMEIKYSALRDADQEEFEKKVAEERKNYENEIAQKERDLREVSASMAEQQKENEQLKAELSGEKKKNQTLKKQNAQTKRKSINVDDDDIAA